MARLEGNGVPVQPRLPKLGKALLIDAAQVLAAREILFVGVEPLGPI